MLIEPADWAVLSILQNIMVSGLYPRWSMITFNQRAQQSR